MEPVVVIGGGVGGLTAAIDLARLGYRVVLCERQAWLGGKLRTVEVAGRPVDSGPTVLTMRGVFDRLYADAGQRLDDHVQLDRAEIIARHAWGDGARLDLYADVQRSRDAIAAAFGPSQGDAYLAWTRHCRAIYEEVEQDFIFAQRPGMLDVARSFGVSALTRLSRIDSHRTVWRAAGSFFSEPRLQQLFGRYATYTGASPFEAPGTLNLVAHVEQAGVWTVRGGMAALARALADLATHLGVELRTGAEVEELEVGGSPARVRAVRLRGGERLPAAAVVFNGDVSALGAGLLGPAARAAAPLVPPGRRSLSALTWSAVATLPLPPAATYVPVHHNVFFGDDYRGEFDAIFRDGRLPADPTVYLCAQDRTDGAPPPDGPERLFFIVNAPARGDTHPIPPDEEERCTTQILHRLRACGLPLEASAMQRVVTRPRDYAALYPATGGALYGAAAHSWRSSFDRSGARAAIPGLYLAGGSVHPGAGVPMVATSGRLAAQAVAADLPSTSRSRPAATPGGTSTSSAPTAASA